MAKIPGTRAHGKGTANEYARFLERKVRRAPATGLADVPLIAPTLYPHQRDLAAWALRGGRRAVFADTGLGKSRVAIEWARAVAAHASAPVFILTPLAVAPQFVAEATAIDPSALPVRIARDGAEVISDEPGIYAANYERLHRFDTSAFAGIVCDESSCIKHHDARTFGALCEAFATTPFKLCATATPAPNDWTELGTHAEFLGVCTRLEMLAEYFCHDGGETQVWRLKGHARGEFWRWVASWAALVRHPRELGHATAGYDLPPLAVHKHLMPADAASVRATGLLFAEAARTLGEQRAARRGSLDARVTACADTVRAEPGERWVVWCELNAEQDALADEFGDDCFSVYGSLELEEKESRLAAFASGERRVLLSKPSIAGWGLNLQSVARVAFVGVSHSFESYYQAVRRCYRFGNPRRVEVHLFASALEGAVLANLERKEREARAMADALAAETGALVRAEVVGGGAHATRSVYAAKQPMRLPGWLAAHATEGGA